MFYRWLLFGKMKVLEMAVGQPHNTLNVLKATERDTLKWLKMVKFMLSKLCHNFN